MLKHQYSGHGYVELAHWKRSLCWERLRAWGEGGNRGWDGWMASSPHWAWVWAKSCVSHYLGDSERQGSLVCCSSWFHKESDRAEQQNNNHNNTLKWESEFLLVELKNELHKQANTHSSKQIYFKRERMYKAFSIETERGWSARKDGTYSHLYPY